MHQKRQCLWHLFVIFEVSATAYCRHDVAFTVVYIHREFPADRLKKRQLAAGSVYYAGTWLSRGRLAIGNNRNGRSA